METIDQETGEITTGALITLDPESYTAAVYEPFRNKLTRAITDSKDVRYDVTTAGGMETAKTWRATFRTLRTGADKAREQRKAPILEIGRLLDSRFKLLKEEIEPYESRFDADIKAEELRKEQEKIAKARAEADRIAGIQSRIIDIANLPVKCAPINSFFLQLEIESLQELVVDASFAEFADDAKLTQLTTLAKLDELLKAKLAAEAEAERIKAEQAELEKLRAEKAERERLEAEKAAAAIAAESKRLADERATFEKQQAEARAKQAEEDRIAREKLDAERAELERQRKEIEAERSAKALAPVEVQTAPVLVPHQAAPPFIAEEIRLKTDAQMRSDCNTAICEMTRDELLQTDQFISRLMALRERAA